MSSAADSPIVDHHPSVDSVFANSNLAPITFDVLNAIEIWLPNLGFRQKTELPIGQFHYTRSNGPPEWGLPRVMTQQHRDVVRFPCSAMS